MYIFNTPADNDESVAMFCQDHYVPHFYLEKEILMLASNQIQFYE